MKCSDVKIKMRERKRRRRSRAERLQAFSEVFSRATRTEGASFSQWNRKSVSRRTEEPEQIFLLCKTDLTYSFSVSLARSRVSSSVDEMIYGAASTFARRESKQIWTERVMSVAFVFVPVPFSATRATTYLIFPFSTAPGPVSLPPVISETASRGPYARNW